MAPDALSPSPYVQNAQGKAWSISDGAFLGNNPGQATYDRLQRAGSGGGLFGGGNRDPSMNILGGMARSQPDQPGNAALARIGAGGENPADGYASAVAGGQYLNAQPSASLYSSMMSNGYLNGNPYLENMIGQTNADVSRQANRMFGARGMGAGISSAFADIVSKNLANNEGVLRYQNYNDAANRQLQAAGQSDAAWSGERGRMDASTGLLASNHNASQDRALAAAQALNQSSQQGAQQQLQAAQALGGQYNAGQDRYNAGQDRALEAARAGDVARSDQIAQMLQSLAMTGQLRDAEYAGIAPTLSLLNTAADLPYIGVGALNGNVRQASDGYSTTTQKTSGGLGGVLGAFAGSLASGLGGNLASNILAPKR